MIQVNSIITALDTPKSILPFLVKDMVDNSGKTLMANHEGGKHEARERGLEEFGTSLFWIGGIPAVRKIGNFLFKNKFDTNISWKRINSEGIQSYFANESGEFSKKELKGINFSGKKLKTIKDKLIKTGYKLKDPKMLPKGAKGLYKTYHAGLTAASVLINLGILMFALPKFNQYLSRKIIAKETQENKNKLKEQNIPKLNISKPEKQGKKPVFSGLSEFFKVKDLLNFPLMAEEAQVNVQNSMLLLDYGISGSRVTTVPRDNNERIEYLYREGSIIFFFYYAADLIKDGIAKLSNKLFKTPINLEYKLLASKEFSETLQNLKSKDDVESFVNLRSFDKDYKDLKDAQGSKVSKKELKKLTKSLKEEVERFNEINIIKMIDEELADAEGVMKEVKNKNGKKEMKEVVKFKNFTLQMAQEQGLINVEKDGNKWIRNSKKYIDTDKIIELKRNLENFYEEAIKAVKNGTTLEKVIKKTKKVKIASIVANLAICCVSLSYLMPKGQYMIREYRTKTKEAPGIKFYQDLAEKNKLEV